MKLSILINLQKHMNIKEREKKEKQVRRAKKRKGIEALRVKPQPHPGQLMHSYGMKKRMETERNRERVPNQTIQSTPNDLLICWGVSRGLRSMWYQITAESAI